MSEMKLSESIRLGAMLGPQLTDGRTFGPDGASCAHGSALLAVGHQGGCHVATLDYWYSLLAMNVVNPEKPRESFQMFSIIRELNDDHGWTREQIADWVETIERRADAESVRTEQETASTAVSFAQKA